MYLRKQDFLQMKLRQENSIYASELDHFLLCVPRLDNAANEGGFDDIGRRPPFFRGSLARPAEE
jgi:hypothetical protein